MLVGPQRDKPSITVHCASTLYNQPNGFGVVGPNEPATPILTKKTTTIIIIITNTKIKKIKPQITKEIEHQK